MTPSKQPDGKGEEFWHDFLTRGGDSMTSIGRRVFKRIPSNPRCRLCAAPFRGPGAPQPLTLVADQ